MRKLKIEVQISLDGFGADSEGTTDWLVWNWATKWNWDKSLQKFHEMLIASTDTVLHSRKMLAGQYLDHWRSMAAKPGNQRQFAVDLLSKKNYAFSKKKKRSSSTDAELITDNYVDVIKNMKRRKGKDIIAFGGVSFISSLISADLVDEYYLIINPTIIGKGKSIYKSVIHNQTLALRSATSYKCGVVVLHYSKA